jgi:spore germination cell wall hydrolase CwlJ-like protein
LRNLTRLPQNRRRDRWLPPAIFGLAAWLAMPAIAARGDLAGLLAGLDTGTSQWRMVLTSSPAGSIHQAALAFGEAPPGSGLAGDAGLVLPDGRRIAIEDGTKGKEPTSDEDRVNRRAKKGRVVAVEPMLPPRSFTAGRLERRAALGVLPGRSERTSFAAPGAKPPMQMAGIFFRKAPPAVDAGVPPLLAGLVTNSRGDALASAYAPPRPDYARVSPFDQILKAKPDVGRFVPVIGPQDHAWAASVLPPQVFSPAEQQCLASGIYFEARGETLKGQAAVAQVILNRVRNPAYPGTICGVVYQNEDWRNRCQFSFACDHIRDRVNSRYHWKVAREVALAVTAGKIWLPEVGSATHYHAVYVHPAWARSMEKLGRIGRHVFYRTYGGGWS